MEAAFLIGLVVLTSLLAWAGGVRWLRLAPAGLRDAFSTMLELVGAALVFFVLNAVVGAVIILGVRGLTPWFLSIYMLNDVSLLVLSVLQGIVFESWRRSRAR